MKPWERGSMTFTDNWAKPPHMNRDEWLKSDEGRTWVSKDGERPSEFFARILKDMPDVVSTELMKEILVRAMLGKTADEVKKEIERLEGRYR